MGAPDETEEDVDRSISLAKKLDLDYVIVTKLQFWPGTKLFLREKERITFDLFAEKGPLYTVRNQENAIRWQKKFYRQFYMRPDYVLKRIGKFVKSPRDILIGFFKLLCFITSEKETDDFI